MNAYNKNPNSFEEEIKINIDKVSKKLSSKFDTTKLDIIKSALRERNILFDENIDSLNELRYKIIDRLDKIRKNEVNNLIEGITKNLQKLIDELKLGSTTAFTRFMTSTYEILIKPISKGSIVALASRSAIVLAPTPELKTIVISGIISHSLYKLIRSNKYQNIFNQNYECNGILRELEVTKDEKGNITDSRFNSKLQSSIINFLEIKNIEFNNTGYLSLRECMYNLKLNDRINLINFINNFKGNPIDINSRIGKYNKKLSQRIKNGISGIIVPITTGIGYGTGIAARVNSIDPSITAAPINGTGLGVLLSKLLNSPLVGWISGILGAGITVGGQYIPVIGTALENIFATENMIIFGGLGATVGFAGIFLNRIIRLFNNIKKNIIERKEKKEILEIDNEIYSKENELEYKKVNNIIKKKQNTEEEKMLINIINNYAKNNNIDLGSINNFEELKFAILNNEKRKKLLKFIPLLNEYNNRDKNVFKRTISSTFRVICWGITLYLAGLSVIDIMEGNTFLEGFSENLFNVPNALKKVTPITDKSNEIIEVVVKKNNGIATPTLGNVPVLPTPHPNIIPIATPRSVAAMDFKYFISSNSDYMSRLIKLPTDEAYKCIFELYDENLITNCINNCPKSFLARLVDYMNTADISILKGKGYSYDIILSTINNNIKAINSYIDWTKSVTKNISNLFVPITGAATTIDEYGKVRCLKIKK